jgi:hypothetical protein
VVLRAIWLGDCRRERRRFILNVVGVQVGLLCCGLQCGLLCGLLGRGSANIAGIPEDFTHSLLFLFPRITVVWLLPVRVSVRLPAFFRLCIHTSFLLVLLLLRFRR